MAENVTYICQSLKAKKGQGIEFGLEGTVALSICVPTRQQHRFGQRYQVVTVLILYQ